MIALSVGCSFVRLNNLCTELRSPIGQIEEISGESRLGGMIGWLLTFGYVWTMAMYAFAFSSYLQKLVLARSLAYSSSTRRSRSTW